MQINFWFIAIVAGLFLVWKVDFFATLLNLKRLGEPIPKVVAGVMDEETHEQVKEYTRSKSVLQVGESIFFLLVLFVFWWLGGFNWLNQWARGLGQGEIVTGLIFVACLLLAQHLLEIPFSLYRTFGIEEAFGFNRSTFGGWVGDWFKGTLIAGLVGAGLLALVLWILQSVPLAWLWAWLAVTAVSLFMLYVSPTLILPLFNKFKPLPEGELKTAIHAMAKQCDFPLTEISVMDGSRRSTKANAFFIGFGNQKQIVLFDTLIEKHTQDELVAVLAHEIGHYKERHIPKSLAISVISSGLAFFALGLLLPHQPFYRAFGIEGMPIYAGLVFFGILMSPLNRVFSVAGNWMSRKFEYEADAYAVRATGGTSGLSDALKKLSRDHLGHPSPDPFFVFLNHSHPPVARRIEAMEKVALRSSD